MSGAWTSGPWVVETHDKETWVAAYCNDDDPWFVCKPEPYIGPGTNDRALANAHLIAAAPDLYAALEEANRLLGGIPAARSNPKVADAITANRRALSKARGEPK